MTTALQPHPSNYNLSYSAGNREFVTMLIGDQLFGISVMAVQDVLRRQMISNVPLAPRIVAGSLNLRGRIVTAIDMRLRLNMEPFQSYSQAMHVVVQYREELISLVVDNVGEVLSLPQDTFESVPGNMVEAWRSVASGVFKLESKLLVILNVDSIIN